MPLLSVTNIGNSMRIRVEASPSRWRTSHFERTARQIPSYQPRVVSFRFSLSGGQPLNSGVGRLIGEKTSRRLLAYKRTRD